jgi:lauroyl/myristoyl acyltransferase
MKRVRGQNLFTIESINRNRPQLRPEIANKVNAILESLKDGETVWFEEDDDEN